MKNMLRLAAVGLGSGVLAMGAATGAYADHITPGFSYETQWYNGHDFGSYGEGVHAGLTMDNECDGHSVYVELVRGDGVHVKRFDSNGCNNGYESWTTNKDFRFVKGRLCETRPGADACSAWKNV